MNRICQFLTVSAIIIAADLNALEADCTKKDLLDFSKHKVAFRVVSLESSVNRRGFMEAQFQALKAAKYFSSAGAAMLCSDLNIHFVDAIVGKSVNRQALIDEGYVMQGWLLDGELGLLRTTTEKVIPEAKSMDDETILTIFEDDVVIPVDMEFGFREALKAVPKDWDILFLGCNRDILCDEMGNVRSRFLPKCVIEGVPSGDLCPSSARTSVEQTPWDEIKGECTPGTWAYALRSSSAAKIQNLIQEAKPLRYPIDDFYRRLVSEGKIRAYCLAHDLVRSNVAMPSQIR